MERSTMKRISQLAHFRLIACLAVAASVACHDLHASNQKIQQNAKNAEQDAVQRAIARRARLRRELSRLIASTRCEEICPGLSPHQRAAAAKRIRHLSYNLQESEAKVSSLELEWARAINRVAPGVVSHEEMCRLKCRDQIEKLMLEQKRLASASQCPQTHRRLAKIELSIAERRIRIAEANVSEVRRFPPGAISEQEFRLLLSTAQAAKMRVENLRSAGAKSDPR
jgi:hypothetical protein